MILLQAAGGSGAMGSILMIVLMIAIFYFFMIRPQMKRQKEVKKFQEGLQKGDNVIVAGGIFAKVVEVRGDSLVVEVDDNTKLRVIKSSVFKDATDASAGMRG